MNPSLRSLRRSFSPGSWLFLALLLTASLASPSFAQIVTWVGGTSGTFATGGNWNTGTAPGVGETANFANAGAVTVNFNAGATFGLLSHQGTTLVGPPDVAPTLQLNLGNNTVEITASNALQVLSTNSSGVRTVIVNGGTLNLGGTNNLQAGGTSVASTNSVIRLENGAAVNLGTSGSVQIGNSNSLGELQIVGGSTLTENRGGVIGRQAGAVGLVTVSGAGSSWSLPGTIDRNVLAVGGAAKGTLNIEAGATVSSARVINVGKTNTETGVTNLGDGTILVTGSGSSLSANEFYIGGGRGDRTFADVLADGDGLVTFQQGATGIFSTILRVLATDTTNGTLVINTVGGSKVTATAAAQFDDGSVFRFGLSTPGADAALMVGGTLTLGGGTLEAFLPVNFSANLGDSFKLAEYTTLSGAFENSTVSAGDYLFSINYALGGDDVIGLTVIPEPSTTALLAVAMGTCLLIWKSRRRSSISARQS